MEDVHRAGGIPAILNEIARSGNTLHLDRQTVSGVTLEESMAYMYRRYPETIGDGCRAQWYAGDEIDYDQLAPSPAGRYEDIEQAEQTDASGRPVRYLRRRFLPRAETLAAMIEIAVEEGDRLDLIATRTIGDPVQYWRVADANNAPGNPGSTTAALFLRPFAGDLPWAHLDVAGPARASADDAEIVKGGTGFGVRTLVRWLEAGAQL